MARRHLMDFARNLASAYFPARPNSSRKQRLTTLYVRIQITDAANIYLFVTQIACFMVNARLCNCRQCRFNTIRTTFFSSNTTYLCDEHNLNDITILRNFTHLEEFFFFQIAQFICTTAHLCSNNFPLCSKRFVGMSSTTMCIISNSYP